jgi:hypothetical protein
MGGVLGVVADAADQLAALPAHVATVGGVTPWTPRLSQKRAAHGGTPLQPL